MPGNPCKANDINVKQDFKFRFLIGIYENKVDDDRTNFVQNLINYCAVRDTRCRQEAKLRLSGCQTRTQDCGEFKFCSYA